MKNELYFLRFGFVKKMIVRKHINLVKKSIESLNDGEGSEELKEAVRQDFYKMLCYNQDKVIRDWIDFYYANKEGKLLRKIYQMLDKHSSTDNIKIKPLSGVRYLMEYLNW